MSSYPVVLYVEDDPRSCKVMRLLLIQQMGLSEVTIFEDSHNFMARVAALQPPPDVIFLDIHVKPHSGFEMLEMLRQLPQFDHTPMVALTASVMNEEVEQLQIAGFHGCLAKPLDTDTFPHLLERILSGEVIWNITG